MPRPVDLSAFNCSVARTLDVVGDKWTLLVLRDCFYGVRRFGDFVEDLGIARNVLTDRLARLVDQGVLRKEQYSEHPPRFEYRLTAKGRDLLPIILTMLHWGDRWADPGEAGVAEGGAGNGRGAGAEGGAGAGPDGATDAEGGPVDLIHRDCGHVTHAVVTCAHCGDELTPFNTLIEPLPPVIGDVVEARRLAIEAS